MVVTRSRIRLRELWTRRRFRCFRRMLSYLMLDVKRILESQPQVSSASVNLATETAIVWPVSEAKNVPNWQKQLGEALAKHLTSCGFMSNLRGQGATEGDISM
uniref:Peptidase M20 dimerisation domain-containing protein n=1 Tax=Salix viminalis TaxID=40686 RepID=A0A6N2MC39_SALVM